MSLTFNMVGGGSGGSLKDTDAVLIVTVPTGSTVTATKGGTTLTPTMWVKAADNTLDCAIFSIPASQFDSTTPWTITATDGANTASTTVLITTNKEYEVFLNYNLYIIRNGVVPSGISIANNGGTLTYYTEYINLHSPASSGSYASVYTVDKINVQDYDYLVCDCSARGYYKSPSCPAFGLFNTVKSGANESTFYASKTVISAGTNTLSNRAVQYLDISQFNKTDDSYYIGFQEAGSGNSDWQGDFNCYNLYLSHEIPQ